MFIEGIFPIGDGLLDIDVDLFKDLLVPHDINEIYEVEQTPFARGKFAAVRRAVHKNSGVHFAAKFLKRRRRAQSSDKEIKHEIAVLKLCDGAENIVKLNAVHESRSDTALLLELATGGELQTLLDNEECLSEAHARICMREVLKALQFLHKRSIAHLDLKPQNILLTGEHIEDGLKLCDFGISRVVAEGTNVREIVGTPDYVAPEVLQYEPLSLLTDIWSVGVLTYVLLSGFSPFGGETKQETFLNISQCALTFPDKLFGGVSASAIDFIRRALRIKPNDRMTAAGCLEHIWLKDECSIDRQIFNNMAKGTDVRGPDEMAHDHEEDAEEDEEEDEEGEEEEEEERDVSEISTDDNNAHNSTKMDSSDIEPEQHDEITSIGKVPNGRTATKKCANGTKSRAAITTTTTTTTTTAIVTVPAMRATTIPLRNTLQHQPNLQVAARRHSTDSNKENTFLAVKKIAPAATSAAKKLAVAATTTTATIIIAPSAAEATVATASNIVATITLPNGSNGCSDKTAQCLFPDAPTTPKVIRKAPTNDTSPTSVKALVKKFQHEGSSAEKRLKEVLANPQQFPTLQQSPPQTNGFAIRKSSTPTSPTANGKASSKGHVERSTTCEHNNKKPPSNQISNGQRRSSEPLTAVHKKSAPPSSPAVSTTTASVSTANVASYKSTCVLCLTCGGSNISASSVGSSSTTAAAATATSTTTTTTGCRHSVVAGALSNGSISSSNSTTSVVTSNGSSGAGSTTAILLSSNHHQQLHHAHMHHHHHHHHHHHVAKSAANNLSLDQGIIC